MSHERVGFMPLQSSYAPKLSLFVVESPFRDVLLNFHQSRLCSDLMVAIGSRPVPPSRLLFLMDFDRLFSNHNPDSCVLETFVVLGRLSCRRSTFEMSCSGVDPDYTILGLIR